MKKLSQFISQKCLVQFGWNLTCEVVTLAGISTAKIVLFRQSVTELIIRENCVFLIPVNNSLVWCTGFFGRMTHYRVSWLVCPLFKKGDRKNLSNYWPISLTSVCSKVMEHTVYSNIMSHMESNNIYFIRYVIWFSKMSFCWVTSTTNNSWSLVQLKCKQPSRFNLIRL